MSRGTRPAPSGPPPRRGRPARLSRERILRATLRLLEQTPPEAITMARVAAALGTAPMSLYTHVRGREDLLDGAAQLALEQHRIEIPRRGSWQTRVRAWCCAVRAHLQRTPQVIRVIRHGGRHSTAWLQVRAALVRALAPSGLSERALADAVRWTMQTVIGAVMLERVTPHELSVEGDPFAAYAAVERLPQADRTVLEPLLPHLGGHDRDSFFEYTVDRVIAALEPLATRPRP